MEELTLSRLTVVSRHDQICQCGNRWQCDECRRYWAGKRYRNLVPWLMRDVCEPVYFGTFTLREQHHWLEAVGILWDRWEAIRRARERLGINRAVASLHLVNRLGDWMPHLHAVLSGNVASLDAGRIDETWKAGFVFLEVANEPKACLRYAIAGGLPASPVDRDLAARWLARKHTIRRFGR